MRDHTKLRAFEAADTLAIAVYAFVKRLPASERYGLSLQLRRAAVSTAANIVEGCARSSARDYAHFLSMAYGSAREAQYELGLAVRLGYVPPAAAEQIQEQAARTTQLLSRLVLRVREFQTSEAH